MGRVRVTVGGTPYSLEGDDVLAWVDVADDRPVELSEELLTAYVVANPRPAPDAQGAVNVPARQRMALLRRLAAGPASRRELLTAMRDAAGYVGGDDWRNRMDELRGAGQRGGGHTPLPIDHDAATDTYRLTESFPALTASERDALGRVKAVLHDVDDGGLALGRMVLNALLPDVPEVRDPEVRGRGRADPGQPSSSSELQGSSPRSAARNRR